MEVEEYVYTPGIHGRELAESLKEGRLVAMKCPDGLYFPPRTYCRDGSKASIVELGERPWLVISYTVVYEDLEGRKLEKPVVLALVAPEGVKGGIIHVVEESPERIRINMKVRPVLRSREERKGTIEDIALFKPLD
jgi:uncharacterized OB-fold protein